MANLTPNTIGRYKILKKLGQGTQGVVYLANDPVLRRRVAIKELFHGFVAVEREGGINAQVEHDNVVRVYDVIRHEDKHCIVMEYLPESLKGRVVPGGMPVSDAVNFAKDIAQGLVVLHENKGGGIVHKDIKPGNVLIEAGSGNQRSRAKITDFGSAHVTGIEGFAQTVGFLGSPAYMAPEQWNRLRVTVQSDIYSLGCVLYEMLTGVTPYSEHWEHLGPDTEHDYYIGFVQDIVLNSEILPTPVREIRPDVPEELEAIVSRAIQKDSAARYQTMREFLESLNELDVGAIEIDPQRTLRATDADSGKTQPARTRPIEEQQLISRQGPEVLQMGGAVVVEPPPVKPSEQEVPTAKPESKRRIYWVASIAIVGTVVGILMFVWGWPDFPNDEEIPTPPPIPSIAAPPSPSPTSGPSPGGPPTQAPLVPPPLPTVVPLALGSPDDLDLRPDIAGAYNTDQRGCELPMFEKLTIDDSWRSDVDSNKFRIEQPPGEHAYFLGLQQLGDVVENWTFSMQIGDQTLVQGPEESPFLRGIVPRCPSGSTLTEFIDVTIESNNGWKVSLIAEGNPEMSLGEADQDLDNLIREEFDRCGFYVPPSSEMQIQFLIDSERYEQNPGILSFDPDVGFFGQFSLALVFIPNGDNGSFSSRVTRGPGFDHDGPMVENTPSKSIDINRYCPGDGNVQIENIQSENGDWSLWVIKQKQSGNGL